MSASVLVPLPPSSPLYNYHQGRFKKRKLIDIHSHSTSLQFQLSFPPLPVFLSYMFSPVQPHFPSRLWLLSRTIRLWQAPLLVQSSSAINFTLHFFWLFCLRVAVEVCFISPALALILIYLIGFVSPGLVCLTWVWLALIIFEFSVKAHLFSFLPVPVSLLLSFHFKMDFTKSQIFHLIYPVLLHSKQKLVFCNLQLGKGVKKT